MYRRNTPACSPKPVYLHYFWIELVHEIDFVVVGGGDTMKTNEAKGQQKLNVFYKLDFWLVFCEEE
jgi:hypothetical protein